MTLSNHILVLSNRSFVQQQLHSVFGDPYPAARRPSFWRGWGFPEPVAP